MWLTYRFTRLALGCVGVIEQESFQFLRHVDNAFDVIAGFRAAHANKDAAVDFLVFRKKVLVFDDLVLGFPHGCDCLGIGAFAEHEYPEHFARRCDGSDCFPDHCVRPFAFTKLGFIYFLETRNICSDRWRIQDAVIWSWGANVPDRN